MKPAAAKISRRNFIQGAAAAAFAPALTVGLAANGKMALAEGSAANFVSDFIHITADDRVIVVVKHLEAGQGPATGLATLAAEELDANWEQVETIFAPADVGRYANTLFGAQMTGGSTAIANSFMQYREAGALARARLLAAAAAEWNAPAGEIKAANGVLQYKGKRATFGQMAAAAAKMPAPAQKPALKSPAQFVHIGKENRPRKDLAGKLNGAAVYSMDVRPDNLVYVAVLRSPKFGGKLRSFNDAAAKATPNYIGARQIPAGVAVYANTQWGALAARRAITAEWDFSAAETRSSAQMWEEYRAALNQPGLPAANNGDAAAALAGAAKTVTADFEFPFLAHAPMEPLNCVIARQGDGATVWDGCQMPTGAQAAVAQILSLPPKKVKIVSTLAGGTFGRRATPTADYQSEAATALLASPQPQRPHKTIWTREDDIRGGYYRPMYAHRATAGLDSAGNIVGWQHALAGKSLLIGTPFEQFAVKDGIDASSVGGVANLAYSAPNLHVSIRNMKTPTPVLWWRSVEHTHTAFAVEVLIDMLAEAAGEDAVAFRLRHLQNKPRHAAVLRAAAKAANWGKPRAGRHMGVAVHESFNSFVAQVAEVSLQNGAVKVERVVCAVDCGIAVNPDIVRAQMESGIGYALGAAMRNQITLAEGGEVEQNNFPNYEPLRMKDMPKVETHIVASSQPPTGAGEPGVPPLAPALAGAIYAATGKRITRQPFAAHGVKFA